MTKTDLFTKKVIDTETATSEELRQSLGMCSLDWRAAVLAELDRRGEPFEAAPGGTPWPFEAPVSPYETKSSPWNTRPGTLARHDEEEETIHGVN